MSADPFSDNPEQVIWLWRKSRDYCQIGTAVKALNRRSAEQWDTTKRKK